MPVSRFFIYSALLLQLFACSSQHRDFNADPLESYNRFMYKTNKKIDQFTLKPISKGYKKITPDFVERRVSNFYRNILEINVFANHLLQGKLRQAGLSSSRFVWNTTLGLAGLFDVATDMGIEVEREDFGQTLRVWGISEGPYFIIPLVGPSTTTDTLGWGGDFLMSPFSYYDWGSQRADNMIDALGIVELRATFLGAENQLDSVREVTDEYTFVRDFYLQHRRALANDGEVTNNAVDDEFDRLYEDTAPATP